MEQSDSGPIARIAELEIDPDCLDAYARLLREEVEASLRLERGVLALHAVSEKGAPWRVRVFEIYADQSAYEAHLRSPHFLKYKAAVFGMVRSQRLIETDPIVLASKGQATPPPRRFDPRGKGQ